MRNDLEEALCGVVTDSLGFTHAQHHNLANMENASQDASVETHDICKYVGLSSNETRCVENAIWGNDTGIILQTHDGTNTGPLNLNFELAKARSHHRQNVL